ncbi:SMP-30/gluconolactonase/LRE family protein [Mangrovibrevibacter kandeliae]|uniref:SMP-30/gluconolactonase/LRE family protein n=1 Tax=Mangrovibrevibacter kandeliae TaxID=2968473 RepID=UPI0021189FB3|nr:SMP-30/gluconolactonase/LRE family protein [Aurantimonas sp. CSK15Z-1]MCQ8783376.1 SMP-30/gluconolactonase/LRE family protein [Aurantimonas sp. CSK15Z-1]
MTDGTADTVGTRIVYEEACRLGEGCTYDPASDTAWWFDIKGKALFEHNVRLGQTRKHPLPFMASALAIVTDDTQLVFAEDGLYLRDATSGNLSLHLAVEADDAVTRSNDARVHQSGAFWLGTMGRKGEAGAGAIYWYRGGELRRLYANVSIPNAICFSPDGGTAYFTDTKTNRINRVAIDPATGLPTGDPSVLHDLGDETGGPDGAVCDADGLIWNAHWGGGRIDVYSPSGERLRSIAVPVKQPSCPAFIGPALDRLLVTSAYDDMDDETRANDPDAGKTLVLDLPVKGRIEPRIRL